MDQKVSFRECERIAQIAQLYAFDCETIYNELFSNVTKKQYGIGGEFLHRGYYCPSLILDIITNAKRGRTVRKPSSTALPQYVFGYDTSDQLLTIETAHGREFIIREGHTELGIAFGKSNWIESISETIYDEAKRIQSYSFYVYEGPKHRVIDFTKEVYSYGADYLLVDWYRFLNSKTKPILEHYRYCFSVVDGFLESYTCEKYEDGTRVPHIWDSRTYRVKLKRKI